MKNGQTLTSEKKKREIVHVYVLLFAMCIVVALLTYVIPAGSYERETVDGQTIVVAGSYQAGASLPQLFSWFSWWEAPSR